MIGLPFFLVFIRFIIARVIFVDHAGEAEFIFTHALDFAQLVQVHLAEVEDHVIFLYFPVEREAVRNLKERLEVVW